jgi:hypothetical protein
MGYMLYTIYIHACYYIQKACEDDTTRPLPLLLLVFWGPPHPKQSDKDKGREHKSPTTHAHDTSDRLGNMAMVHVESVIVLGHASAFGAQTIGWFGVKLAPLANCVSNLV